MLLLFAVHRCPKMLSMGLWPYTLQMANKVRNSMPLPDQELSPFECFAQVAVAPKLKHFLKFGCPTYVLDSEQQGEKVIQKWQTRSPL